MSLSLTYRADWLRQDLLHTIEMLTNARIQLAVIDGFQAEMVECHLKMVAQKLAVIVASPSVPELADLLASLNARDAA